VVQRQVMPANLIHELALYMVLEGFQRNGEDDDDDDDDDAGGVGTGVRVGFVRHPIVTMGPTLQAALEREEEEADELLPAGLDWVSFYRPLSILLGLERVAQGLLQRSLCHLNLENFLANSLDDVHGKRDRFTWNASRMLTQGCVIAKRLALRLERLMVRWCRTVYGKGDQGTRIIPHPAVVVPPGFSRIEIVEHDKEDDNRLATGVLVPCEGAEAELEVEGKEREPLVITLDRCTLTARVDGGEEGALPWSCLVCGRYYAVLPTVAGRGTPTTTVSKQQQQEEQEEQEQVQLPLRPTHVSPTCPFCAVMLTAYHNDHDLDCCTANQPMPTFAHPASTTRRAIPPGLPAARRAFA